MGRSDTFHLFVQALNAVNTAWAVNRFRPATRHLNRLIWDRFGSDDILVGILDSEEEGISDTFSIRHREDTFLITGHPDLRDEGSIDWFMTTDELNSLAEYPERYIADITAINWSWLENSSVEAAS